MMWLIVCTTSIQFARVFMFYFMSHPEFLPKRWRSKQLLFTADWTPPRSCWSKVPWVQKAHCWDLQIRVEVSLLSDNHLQYLSIYTKTSWTCRYCSLKISLQLSHLYSLKVSLSWPLPPLPWIFPESSPIWRAQTSNPVSSSWFIKMISLAESCSSMFIARRNWECIKSNHWATWTYGLWYV